MKGNLLPLAVEGPAPERFIGTEFADDLPTTPNHQTSGVLDVRRFIVREAADRCAIFCLAS